VASVSWRISPLASGERDRDMENTLRYLTVLALIAVLIVLLAGLWNMMRGTSPNLSQTLMRWRVGLQFAAIVVAMILVYFLRP
jgi:Mg2+ and Co2+ transporter CorA